VRSLSFSFMSPVLFGGNRNFLQTKALVSCKEPTCLIHLKLSKLTASLASPHLKTEFARRDAQWPPPPRWAGMPGSGPPFAHTAQACLALPELSDLVDPGSGPRRIGPHAEPSAVSVLVYSSPTRSWGGRLPTAAATGSPPTALKPR